MKLNEILDTVSKTTWSTSPSGLVGSFELDGEKFFIDIDEYDIDLASGTKLVLDVGFRKGRSGKLTGDQKPGRVLGSVLSALKSKVQELQPNVVMFGVLDKNGEVQKRKELYHRLASLISKTTKFDHLSDWVKFDGGEYAYLTDFELSDDDLRIIEKLAAYRK